MNNLLRLEEGVARIVADDPWTLVRDVNDEWPVGAVILPLARWLEGPPQKGVWLGPDDEVESLKPWFSHVPLIVLDFPSFRDGRGCWTGELRAVGDVLYGRSVIEPRPLFRRRQ
ncbi:DUF934 domain-containing protein [Pseudomonas sp. LS2P72]